MPVSYIDNAILNKNLIRKIIQLEFVNFIQFFLQGIVSGWHCCSYYYSIILNSYHIHSVMGSFGGLIRIFINPQALPPQFSHVVRSLKMLTRRQSAPSLWKCALCKHCSEIGRIQNRKTWQLSMSNWLYVGRVDKKQPSYILLLKSTVKIISIVLNHEIYLWCLGAVTQLVCY